VFAMMVPEGPQQRVARRAVVAGRVQGVWFRDSVRRIAEARAVTGWARNLRDGRVEVWAEGTRDAVQAVLEYCREGPPRAVVERVHVDEVAPAGLGRFDVR
jgi:acylphosphatase